MLRMHFSRDEQLPELKYFSFEEIMTYADEFGASDVFLRDGGPIRVKIRGEVLYWGTLPGGAIQSFFPTECKMLREDESDDGIKTLKRGGIDFSQTLSTIQSRIRINLFRSERVYCAVMRLIPRVSLKLSDLGLPACVEALTTIRSGLILVVGPTGSGKTTTLSALLNQVIRDRDGHYLTLEDPIELYLEPRENAVITQRELGKDFTTYAEALIHAMRQAPDVILVGEIRDPKTLALAIDLSETGHLVFATFHATNALETALRLMSFMSGEYAFGKTSLIYALKAIFAQRLLKKEDGTRQPLVELLSVDNRVRTLLRDEKWTELRTLMPNFDGLTFNEHFNSLLQNGFVFKDGEAELIEQLR